MLRTQNEQAGVFGRLANMLCAAACLAWWALSSSFVARGAQESGAMTVNGRAPAKPETPFACSREKTPTKEQRAHKQQIIQKMEAARNETSEKLDGDRCLVRHE